MITTELKSKLQKELKGEITDDAETLTAMSRDTSLFEVRPSLVVYPKDVADVQTIVKEVRRAREAGAPVALAARAGGSCMSGGPLTTGVVVNMKHLNHVLEVSDLNVGHSSNKEGYAVTEPGVYYRDFEVETLKKNLILPSYPASREVAAIGGIVANNAAGERTLEYGQTVSYVEDLDVVLSDGSMATFRALTQPELEQKKKLQNMEGEIYRKMDDLLTENAGLIEAHRPRTSKNAAGYLLWSVRDHATGKFNLAKLICGSQGTLALWTQAKLSLVHPREHRAMLVTFLCDLSTLPQIVERILPLNPESFESYDDHTFTLAVKLLPDLLKQMGLTKAAKLGIDFIPEAAMVATGGVPKMILMAEFAEHTLEEADRKAALAKEALKDLHVHTRIEKDEKESEKYWIVRRESFALLRKNLHGLHTAPFIDDFVVPPSSYPRFLPKLAALLDSYKDKFIYTIAGHIGNGNFHIIPLMDLTKEESRRTIVELAPKVYELVVAEHGTTTGEHNDGIIRTPFLPLMFGPEMIKLFEETKNIFDPLDIFNPRKKVRGTIEDISKNMIRTS